MLTWTTVPDEERTLVVRWTPEGVATIECDCLSERSARSEAARFNAAERTRMATYLTLTDAENTREIERVHWAGQGRLF